MDNRHIIGKEGEDYCAKKLQENGYEILERNFSCRQGEVDIIAKDSKNEYVFIEVKTRSNLKFGKPQDAVNRRKKKHIKLVAEYYIYIKQLYNKNIRFDVMEVYKNGKEYIVNQIKNCELE